MKNLFDKNWWAAVMLLILVGLFWLWLILVKLPLTLPITLIATFKNTSTIFGKTVDWKGWRYNLWIGDDQNVNTMLGGDKDVTVSSRVGFNAKRGNAIALHMEKVIDFLFRMTVGQENHCRASIEYDENHNKNWG